MSHIQHTHQWLLAILRVILEDRRSNVHARSSDLALMAAAKHGQVPELGRLPKLMVSGLLTAEPSACQIAELMLIDLTKAAAKHDQVQELGRLPKLMVSCLLTAEPSAGQIAELMLANLAKGAAKHGQVSVLEWLCTRTRLKKSYPGIAKEAAKHGQVPVLEWLCTKTCLKKSYLGIDEEAAKHGQVPVLEWLHTRWHTTAHLSRIITAAAHGQAQVLKWMQDANLGMDRMWNALEPAARYGHVHVLEWMQTANLEIPDEQQWRVSMEAAVEIAARRGHVPVLEWMYEHGNWPAQCVWRLSDIALAAACHNHVNLLKWMRNKGLRIEILVMAAEVAVMHGRDQVLDWMCSIMTANALRPASDHLMECLFARGMSLEMFKEAGRAELWLRLWRKRLLAIITTQQRNKPRLPQELWDLIHEN